MPRPTSLLARVPLATAGLVLLAAAAASQEWRALPGAPVGIQVQDVFFRDDRLGWTSVDSTVYRTVDGGDTWRSFVVPGMSMRSLTFSTPSRGWIGSLNRNAPLWASADSGATWQAVDLPEPPPDGICGLWAVNADVVYGCGRYQDPEPTVIKTTNGGVTWTCIDMSAWSAGLVDCFFFTPDSSFVVGRVVTNATVPRILFTGDGGATWSIRHTGVRPDSWCWKISFVNRAVGYVSVEMYGPGLDSHCLKTIDGGSTWNEVPIRTIGIEGIGFLTELLGWVGSDRLWRTTDGGLTWTRELVGSFVNRMRFLRPELGYAAGRTIYKFSTVTAVRPQSITQVKARYRSN